MSFGYYNIISILIVKTAQPQHFKKCLLSIIFTMIHMQTSRKLFQTDKLADIEPTIWKSLIFSSLKKKDNLEIERHSREWRDGGTLA